MKPPVSRRPPSPRPAERPDGAAPSGRPPADLLRELERWGQVHVLRWWGELSEEGRRRLLRQCGRIDFAGLARLVRTLLGPEARPMEIGEVEPAEVLSPEALSEAERRRLAALGEGALAEGRVAVLTVAGGVGTRLGAGPVKGKVPVGPVTGKSLFQLQAETVLALGRRYGRPLHWFVMTSPANHEATREYFDERDWFGLDRGLVHFFSQGLMPVVDDEGKLLLDAPDHIAESPDGHGGCLYALGRSGALDQLAGLGVELLFYHQVDNPLVRIAEPLFLGLHIDSGAQVSSKALPKRDPAERLGHFVVDREGRLRVIEYSDMPPALQQARDPEGRLRFRYGSIAIHIFDREFLAGLLRRGVELPFHRARKKVPYLDERGRLVTPTEPNANKFERFIFDVLPWAETTLVVETTREEFSPVKEPEGPDSPAAARAALARRYARWLEAAGVALKRGPDGEPAEPVEVSPLAALSAEEVRRRLAGGRRLPRPIYLE